MNERQIRVLMIGPDRSVHGGISGVVNNYYDAGLNEKITLRYIGTMVEGSKWEKLWKAVKAYFQFLCQLSQYDIVHVNMASDFSYYRKSVFIRTAYFFHKKIVIHQHGGDFEGFYGNELSDKGRKKVKKVLEMGNAFLVLGTVWKDFFGTIIENDRITVLANSIQIPKRSEKQYNLRKILFLGRLCKEKGISELFDVMPELQKKYPDVHLYLGGIWEDKELKEKALEIGECITDLGWISGKEKQKYLRMCDIFVLPSYFEGQPVSILEAMAYECAIVASKTGDIPQMIIEGETGLFAMPKDAQSLKENLIRLLDDFTLCKKLGENARKKVEAEFSIDNNMRKLISIYKDVLKK